MAQLIVRRLEGALVARLKQRARRHRVSVEEEHRHILRAALQKEGPAPSLKEFLLSIPDVGEDCDFERLPQPQRDEAAL